MPAEWITPPAEYDDSKSLYENKQRDRGTVKCNCGEGVSLNDAARGPNYSAQCQKCGQLFNLSGQQLAPKEQWEEDYGDSY